MKTFKLFSSICLLALFSLISGRVWGQILTFDFAGLAGNEAIASSNFNNVGLTSSTISRGAGLNASNNGGRFNATGWAVISIANAVSGDDYMEFTITPNSGQQFSVSSIVIQLKRSGSGLTAIALRNSVDSYGSNLDGQKSVTDNTSTQSFTFTFAQTNSTTAVTYRLYGFAESNGGTGGPGDGTGNDIVVNGSVTPAATNPTLTSPTVSSITESSAVLGANITSNGGSAITARGTVYSTSSPVTSVNNASAEGGVSTGVFTQSRTGLLAQTQYYYAGYATNSNGTALSSEGSFRTLSNPPTSQASGLTATVSSASQIDLSIANAAGFPSSGATQGGYLLIYSTGTPTLGSVNGQAPSASSGNIFSTSTTILPSNPATTINVTGLSSSTSYNFIIIPYTWDGTNSATYNYLVTNAVTVSATTNAGLPTLISPTATNITSTSATLGANITSNGGSSLSARGTVFSTISPVSSNNNALAEGGSSTGVFTQSRSSLNPQTLYYFAGYATSSAGTAISTESSFRTFSEAPITQVSNLNASAPSSSEITIAMTGAAFPNSGATNAGYVIIYSTGTPTFASSNGQAPSAGVGTIFSTTSTALLSNPATTINVTGLLSATTYNFIVVPYTWDGSNATTYNYLTSGVQTVTQTTLNATAGLQINALNTNYLIDFDNTVPEVNNGQFTASANWCKLNPSNGEMNSNAWSFDASSASAASTFGISYTGGLGQSNGIVNSLGPYSFQVSPSNYAWGIQPTGSGWTPGNITLRIQNQSGNVINELSISYKVWILNNEQRANSFNFSFSANNQNYTSVSSMNLISTEITEFPSPTWRCYIRVVRLTGLNIPSNGYFFLRWFGDDSGGSGSRDEFGLDDISVIANPTSTQHFFSGVFEEVLINDNATFDNNSTINGQLLLNSGILSIANNKQLTLTGNLTNNGTLTLENGATLVQGASSAYSGSGTVQVKQSITGGNNGNSPNGRFWYLGSPVSGGLSSILDAAGANVVKYWDEPGAAWVEITDNTTALDVGRGHYLRSFTPGNQTLTFTGGALNNGTYTLPLTANGASFNGFNLVSNPYPSYLKWDDVAKTNVGSTVWYRTSNGSNNMVFDTYNSNGNVGTSNNGAGNVSQYIPPMQAFWVKVEGSTTGNIVMENADRSHHVSGMQGMHSLLDKQMFANINLIKDTLRDQAIVYSSYTTTDIFDAYDSEKMFQANTPQLYSKINDKKVVINAKNFMQRNEKTPLFMNIPSAGTYSMQLGEFNSSFGSIWLEDLSNGQLQNLLINDIYTFEIEAGQDLARFVLHFGYPEQIFGTDVHETIEDNIEAPINWNDVSVLATDDKTIDLTASLNELDAQQTKIVSVFDMTGRQIMSGSFENGNNQIQVPAANAVYMVHVSVGSAHKVFKVLIQE